MSVEGLRNAVLRSALSEDGDCKFESISTKNLKTAIPSDHLKQFIEQNTDRSRMRNFLKHTMEDW